MWFKYFLNLIVTLPGYISTQWIMYNLFLYAFAGMEYLHPFPEFIVYKIGYVFAEFILALCILVLIPIFAMYTFYLMYETIFLGDGVLTVRVNKGDMLVSKNEMHVPAWANYQFKKREILWRWWDPRLKHNSVLRGVHFSPEDHIGDDIIVNG